MSDFETWFIQQYFFDREQFDRFFKLKDGKYAPKIHTNEVYALVFRLNFMLDAWKARQSEIDQLKAEKEKIERKLRLCEVLRNNQFEHLLDVKAQFDSLRAEKEKLKAEKEGLEKIVGDALEAFNDGAFNYCQQALEKALRGEHV